MQEVNTMTGWSNLFVKVGILILCWSVGSGDLCNIKNLEVDCKFIYEDLGIVQVSGVVHLPDGKLGPANLTLTINVVSHQLEWEHDFAVCHGKKVTHIPSLMVHGFPVMVRMEFEPDISQPHVDTKAIHAFGYMEGEGGERKYQFLRSIILPNWDLVNLEMLPPCAVKNASDIHSRLMDVELQLKNLKSDMSTYTSVL
ncbi:unnamed protein product, partial [Darwinula stevensoni]